MALEDVVRPLILVIRKSGVNLGRTEDPEHEDANAVLAEDARNPAPVSGNASRGSASPYRAEELFHIQLILASRPFNCYSPPPARPPTGHFSPIRRVQPGQRYEDGDQRRDFIHVHDIARTNLAAIDQAKPEVHDLRHLLRQPHTIADMAHALAHIANGPIPINTGQYRLRDVRHITADLRPDGGRARRRADPQPPGECPLPVPTAGCTTNGKPSGVNCCRAAPRAGPPRRSPRRPWTAYRSEPEQSTPRGR
ncbi:hypothetical protein GCM10009854_17710 [Saccharopolyspora halophila]|uniref:NAD-dependent epimerase/dehydratase domain-containing protein n=1 Tax=Saccharopolyspora halophila TaxID=405551 RepID=A0ABP5SZ11_9PSEU